MKYAVVCSSKNALSFVSAISDTLTKAKNYMNKITNSKISVSVIKIETNKYPLFIIEKTSSRRFEFTSDETVIDKVIKNIKKKRAGQDEYFTYYLIENEYFFKPPGEDQMGALDHVHVDNAFLKYYKMGKIKII